MTFWGAMGARNYHCVRIGLHRAFCFIYQLKFITGAV